MFEAAKLAPCGWQYKGALGVRMCEYGLALILYLGDFVWRITEVKLFSFSLVLFFHPQVCDSL